MVNRWHPDGDFPTERTAAAAGPETDSRAVKGWGCWERWRDRKAFCRLRRHLETKKTKAAVRPLPRAFYRAAEG